MHFAQRAWRLIRWLVLSLRAKFYSNRLNEALSITLRSVRVLFQALYVARRTLNFQVLKDILRTDLTNLLTASA